MGDWTMDFFSYEIDGVHFSELTLEGLSQKEVTISIRYGGDNLKGFLRMSFFIQTI